MFARLAVLTDIRWGQGGWAAMKSCQVAKSETGEALLSLGSVCMGTMEQHEDWTSVTMALAST